MKKFLSILMILVTIFGCMTFVPSAMAASWQKNVYTTANIKALCEAKGFTNNRYWSYSKSKGNAGAYTTTAYKATTTSSKKKGDGDYVGYKFAGGEECWAFAGYMGFLLSGDSNPYSSWTKITSVSALKQAGGLQVGDILRTNTHSAMVYSVSGNTVKFVQCQGGENNLIRFNQGFASGGKLRTNFDDIVKNCGFRFVLRKKSTTVSTVTEVQIQNASYPKGTLKKGKGFELKGNVTSNKKIKSVTGTVYDTKTGKAKLSPVTIKPNSTSVQLYTSKINTGIKFGKLPAGSYRLVVEVVVEGENQARKVIETTFTVK